ncbi:hypothetical protein JYU04_01485 [Dehalococcoides mccartyi]|nr:hypothetical protein [Dehalococcoides mccartyi]
MPDKSKFEREIDEILEKSEDPQPVSTSKGRRSGQHRSFEPFSTSVPKRQRPKRSSGITFNPGNLVIGGILLLAVAAFVSTAKLPIAILGIVLVVLGYVLSLKQGSFSPGRFGSDSDSFRRDNSQTQSRNVEPEVKYWRGRRIEDKPQPQDKGKIIDFGSPNDDDKK